MTKFDYELMIIRTADGHMKSYANVSNVRVCGCIIIFNTKETFEEFCEIGEIIKLESNSNAQIIKDFLDIYKSGGMRTVIKVDKLALTETTLFKQFMTAVAEEHGVYSV